MQSISFFTNENSIQLAALMEITLNQDVVAHSILGKFNRDLIYEKYTMSNWVEKLITIYNQALKSSKS